MDCSPLSNILPAMRGEVLLGGDFLIGLLKLRTELGQVGEREARVFSIEEDVIGPDSHGQVDALHGAAGVIS